MRTTRIVGIVLAAWVIIMAACMHPAPKTGIRIDKRGENLGAYVAQELDPARDNWQKPAEVIEALSIKKGMTVADVGAGAGYFTLRLAEAVGPEGLVYASDTNLDLLTQIVKKATEGGFANVKIFQARPSDPQLPFASVDIALVCDNLSRVDYIYTFFDMLRRSIKTGGRLAIIDWDMSSKVGPDRRLRRKRKEVRKIAEGMGFRLINSYDFLPHQYFMVFVLEERYG
jgi:arsenite methyltransferase